MHLRSVYRDGWLCTVYEPSTAGRPNGLEETWGDGVLDPCAIVYEQTGTGPGGVAIATGELYNVDDDPHQFENLWDDPARLPAPSATTSWPTSTPTSRRRSATSRWWHRPDRQATGAAVARSMAAQPLVKLVACLVGPVTSSQTEEPLGEREALTTGEVDHQRHELEHAHAERELVDLIGHEDGGGDEGQVLGPALVQPQADHLGGLERRVGEEHAPEDPQVCRAVLEGPAEVPEDPTRLGRAGRAARPARP